MFNNPFKKKEAEMTDSDAVKDETQTGEQGENQTPERQNNTPFTQSGEEDPMPEGFPEMDEGMMGQVQEMMEKLQKAERAEELERENADLKHRLGRLAADFESYRTRTAAEAAEAEAKGQSKAAQALMPVYDDIDRALQMGKEDPAKLIPGMEAVLNKVQMVFAGLGLEATGRVGDDFDPQWHEAIQVVEGEEGKIVQVYQLGFRMGDKLVRPARVVVSQPG
ncbi:nucleotide exchange factor GrpE [Deinococcus lacus]|uniref:Protein GrpE n=1 Tax=Deinococcus lacus TaxID=392561 RepID=A0ABW1YFE5_9DEIO